MILPGHYRGSATDSRERKVGKIGTEGAGVKSVDTDRVVEVEKQVIEAAGIGNDWDSCICKLTSVLIRVNK